MNKEFPLLVCSISLVAGVTIGGCKRIEKLEKNYPLQQHVCDYFELSEELLTFNLGEPFEDHEDIKLTFPREYFPSPKWRRLRDGQLDGAVFFQLRLVDFGPLTKAGKIAAVQSEPKASLSVLIQPYKDLIKTYDAFITIKKTSNVDQHFPDFEKNEFDLIKIDDSIADIRVFGKSIYINVQDGSIGDLLMCGAPITGDNFISNPNCQHYITTENLSVKFSYDTDLIGNWRDYRRDIMEIMSCASKTYNQ